MGAGPLPFDAIVIVAILLLNACLGYAHEAKAERAVDALASMTAPHASVLRDGQVVSLETSQIVPGDVVVLAEGDTVSADGRLLTAAGLRVAEASLTGESLLVSKRPARLDKTTALGDRTNMAFNGTAVTQGTGRMVVTSTGMGTQVSKIASMLANTEEEPPPPPSRRRWPGFAGSLVWPYASSPSWSWPPWPSWRASTPPRI